MCWGLRCQGASQGDGADARADDACCDGDVSRAASEVERRLHETRRRLKALSAVSLDHSLLRVAPWANPWLLAGVALPVALHMFLLHAPWLRGLFGLAPLTKAHWITVAKFSLPILLVEELTKAVGREVDRRERERRRAASSN